MQQARILYEATNHSPLSFSGGATVVWNATSCSGINLFSVQDDKDLGAQVDDEIESSPSEFPILDEGDYADASAFFKS